MEPHDYRSLFDVAGKRVVVTGGAGILGTEFCTAFAQNRARVAVVDVDGAGAERLAAALRDGGGDAVSVACDVTDEGSVEAMVASVAAAFGGVDVLLNNAGGKSRDPGAFYAAFEDYSLEQWRSIMAVNLDGAFLVARAVGRHMVTQASGGSIIQTASLYALHGPDNRIYEGSEYLGHRISLPAVYSASKGGLVALTRWLATYWGAQGIRVNAVAPGGIESGQNQTFVQNFSRRAPMGRMGRRDEIVGAMLWLASDASSYVTGQLIYVDGGVTAW